MAHRRYHVKLGKTRTTVSIPAVLEELLSLQLGVQPKTQEAIAAVRQWLQAEIDRDPGAIPPRRGASQRLTQQVILQIASGGLIERRDAWIEKQHR